MGNLSCLSKQNAGENPGRYRACAFSAILSKMQTGKFSECQTTEYVSNCRAGRIDAGTQTRIDAELITCEQSQAIGFLFFLKIGAIRNKKKG